ncbi:MAG: hypothetical protein GY788_08730 [bacterium]|nr:hypothetical protein [bacterium]
MKLQLERLRAITEDALEAARLEILDRLVAAELPTTISTDQTIVTLTSGGFQTNWAQKQISGLNDWDAELAIADASVELTSIGLRDQIEPLAKYLDATTNLGLKQPGWMYPNHTGSDGVLLRPVIPLALYYLRALEDMNSPDQKLVSRLIDELYVLATSDERVQVTQFVVAGIDVKQEYEADGVSIRPLSSEEMGHYVDVSKSFIDWRRSPSMSRFVVPQGFDHFMPTCVVEVREQRRYTENVTLSSLPARVALAMFLLGFDFASSGTSVRFADPRWSSAGTHHGAFPVRNQHFHGARKLVQTNWDEIVELAKQLPDISGAERGRSDIVFHRVLKGVGADDSGFLDFVIALESALLQGIKQELRYRFALYGALFLADRYPPTSTFEKLKRIYDVRSSVVHGSEVTVRDRSSVGKDADAIARAVALEIARNDWPDHGALNKKALA